MTSFVIGTGIFCAGWIVFMLYLLYQDSLKGADDEPKA